MAYWESRAEDPREVSITKNPKEDLTTENHLNEDPKEDFTTEDPKENPITCNRTLVFRDFL